MVKQMSGIKKFWNEEDGIGTLEIVLIIAIIIIVAVIFKKWIVTFINRLITKTDKSADDVFK